MRIRIAVLAAVTSVIAMILVTRPAARTVHGQVVAQQPVRSPAARPAMFSPWYGESLRDTLELQEDDIARLEQQVAADPEDFPARLKLMAYHQRADRALLPDDLAKRTRHALWLIEHHPESEILHSPVARFQPGELSPADYNRAAALWDRAASAKRGDAAVQWNAASFFQGLDQERYMRYLEATAAADPNHPFALRPLAHLYAFSILERDPLTARAEAGLEASRNVWVLGNAAHVLQSLYNQSRQAGRPNQRAADLAERYFLRAKALDPNLDRRTILPQIDLQEIARSRQKEAEARREWLARAEDAVANIRRLPVDAFPELPPAVARVLRDRNCTVPQPWGYSTPRNVVRGEFLEGGEAGWAVLCSVNLSTALLVFRSDRDTNPQTINTREDRGYLQGVAAGNIGYSRQIAAVSRDFIMRHYRAYGGPEPPPIERHGIDDAFLEKASITWYWHQGTWLPLQGAD